MKMATIMLESTLWQLLRKSLRAAKPLTVAELRTPRRAADKYLHLERAVVMGLFAAKTVPLGTPVDSVPLTLTAAGRHAAEYGEAEVDSATFAALDTVRSDLTHARLAARLGADPSPPPDKYPAVRPSAVDGTIPDAPAATGTRRPPPAKGTRKAH